MHLIAVTNHVNKNKNTISIDVYVVESEQCSDLVRMLYSFRMPKGIDHSRMQDDTIVYNVLYYTIDSKPNMDFKVLSEENLNDLVTRIFTAPNRNAILKELDSYKNNQKFTEWFVNQVMKEHLASHPVDSTKPN